MEREVVEQSLGYTFTDVAWLEQALTHPSADQKRSTTLAYERLEFLGDAVLELAVCRELFVLYPNADEGVLTKMRAAIVSRQYLCEICRKLGWGNQLTLSPQLEKNGGRDALSVLANTFESVIGAVMMDSNYNAARKVSLKLMGNALEEAASLVEINSKGKLLETLQSINCEGPTYEVEPVSPECANCGPFIAHAWWCGIDLGSAEGPSKHKAQMAAAAAALRERRWEKR